MKDALGHGSNPRGAHNAGIEKATNNGQCFACGKPFGAKQPKEVFTSDPQMQHVGPECFRKIRAAGNEGYQPPLGGPRLWASRPRTAPGDAADHYQAPANNPFAGTVRWTKRSRPRHRGW
jgi:hypothetical protein